ncbi:MAG: nitrite reductase large subunit NirB, partial [Bacteroidota bacterium]|nr:nitrite reductase large subunit NirB [Bacteroidota bacterium]
MKNKEKIKIVVVGNGMVGYKFCEKLLSKSTQNKFEITVFGEEPRVAYDRVHLSEYFGQKTIEELTMAPLSWYHQNNIKIYTGDPIQSINRELKTVHSFHNIEVRYDYLVLATGSAAFVPPINGVEKDGVFVYRTIEDLDMMKDWAKKSKKGAVIGGGLLGLEAAKAMLDLGIKDTTIIEFAPKLMPRQIDEQGSALLKSKLESLGLKIKLNTNTKSIDGDESIKGMSFSDDSKIDVDMLVISAGIKPRDELAKLSGLETGQRGGIVVNNQLQTTDPSIFAIGECALFEGMIYGLVAPGYEMADVVATNLNGGKKEFYPYDMSTKLKLIGVDVASFGDPFATEPNCTTISITDNAKGIYKRINISKDGKHLIGGILVGDAEQYNMLLQTVKNKTIIPPDPEDLILGARGGSEGHQGAGLMSLPDDALICSCESVSKGLICSNVTEGVATTFDAMKKCTKAGTGCGGCTPMVKDLINETLKANGQYIKTVLCEHFDYSRQQLLDLIKIDKLKYYDEVLDKHGKGDGCEICKPAVASILASLWNDNILKQSPIQD